jgi:hypothetical protein
LTSRFFPFVAAFFPASAALSVAALSRPRLVPLFVAGFAAGAAAVAATARRSRDEVAVVATLVLLWLVAFGAGLWRGLTLAAAKRLIGSLTRVAAEAEDA